MSAARGRGQRGYTLIELLLVVSIIVILGNYANYAVGAITGTKRQRARSDAMMLAQGIYGPESRNENGFLAELGRLPDMGNFTSEMSFATTGQFEAKQNFRGIAYGWGGPYALPGADQTALVNDPWGRPWILRPGLDGRICSMGENGADEGGQGDDVCAPVAPPMVNGVVGTLIVFVQDQNGTPLRSDAVEQNYPRVWGADPTTTPPGQLRWWRLNENVARGFFALNSVTMGRHAVEVVGRTGTPYEGARGFASPWVGAGDASVVTIRLRY